MCLTVVVCCVCVYTYTNGVRVISDGVRINDKNENTAGMHVRRRGRSADPSGLQMERLPPVPVASGDELVGGYL